MGILDLLTAVLYTLTGLTVIALFFKVILEAFIGDSRLVSDRLKYKQKEKLIKQADSLISHDNFLQAFLVLQRAIFLEAVRADAELIDKISNHHISILSRMVLISDRKSLKIQNIAVVEDLLLLRAELLRSLLEASNSLGSLQRKRRKEIPAWAIEEYRKKVSEFKDRLETNKRSIESQLKEVYNLLFQSKQSIEVTYH